MKNIYTFLFSTLLVSSLFSQTTHTVTVSNFQFDPAVLTISPGDEVVWTNTEGLHNVDGSEASFPDNPVAFGNELSSDMWTYSFTFDIEGTYDYRCAQHTFMEGTVIVSGVNGTKEAETGVLKAYPIPAEDFIYIEGLSQFPGNSQIRIFDITGKRALESTVSANEPVDISFLKAGIYIFNLTTEDGQQFTGKVLVK
jgi:plastocyanin